MRRSALIDARSPETIQRGCCSRCCCAVTVAVNPARTLCPAASRVRPRDRPHCTGDAPYPGQAHCRALGFWPECFRRLNVKGGQRLFPKETRSALDIEGKHFTIQRPSPDLRLAATLAPWAMLLATRRLSHPSRYRCRSRPRKVAGRDYHRNTRRPARGLGSSSTDLSVPPATGRYSKRY